MFFWVGALVLAFFGGIAITVLLALPWWAAIAFIAVLGAIRVMLTERQPHEKIMDISNGVLIALALGKIIF